MTRRYAATRKAAFAGWVRRACVPRGHNGQSPDRTATGHQHLRPEKRARLAGGAQADGERLGHGRFRHRHGRRNRYGLRLIDDEALAEAALHMGKSHRAAHEPHVEALVVLPRPTITARVAGLARVDGHPSAWRDPGHRGPTSSTVPAISWPSAIG
jgi:hypothetical protein